MSNTESLTLTDYVLPAVDPGQAPIVVIRFSGSLVKAVQFDLISLVGQILGRYFDHVAILDLRGVEMDETIQDTIKGLIASFNRRLKGVIISPETAPSVKEELYRMHRDRWIDLHELSSQ